MGPISGSHRAPSAKSPPGGTVSEPGSFAFFRVFPIDIHNQVAQQGPFWESHGSETVLPGGLFAEGALWDPENGPMLRYLVAGVYWENS